jgi:hypothetical protein
MTFSAARLSLPIIAGLAAVLAGTMPAFAQGTEEERRACTPDAMRLCREYIPNIDRIVACMVARRDELSPACQAFIKPDTPATVANVPTKPTARRTASRATGAKASAKSAAHRSRVARPAVHTAKPVARSTRTAAKVKAKGSITTRPLNLLPTATKPAPAKKASRSKQAQRAQ